MTVVMTILPRVKRDGLGEEFYMDIWATQRLDKNLNLQRFQRLTGITRITLRDP